MSLALLISVLVGAGALTVALGRVVLGARFERSLRAYATTDTSVLADPRIRRTRHVAPSTH
jgi:hypothetical protein